MTEHSLSTGLNHIGGWLETRGKRLMGLFALIGTVGSLISGGVVGYLSMLNPPTQDQMATLSKELREAVSRIELNTVVTQTTVGGIGPKVDRLETRLFNDENRLADLDAWAKTRGKK